MTVEERHVKNLVMVKQELAKAVMGYKQGFKPLEMYHMCRAKAMADALGVSPAEFYLIKRLTELDEGMEDNLMDEQAILLYAQPLCRGLRQRCGNPSYKGYISNPVGIYQIQKWRNEK